VLFVRGGFDPLDGRLRGGHIARVGAHGHQRERAGGDQGEEKEQQRVLQAGAAVAALAAEHMGREVPEQGGRGGLPVPDPPPDSTPARAPMPATEVGTP
jgi:hypothetical protein